MITKTQERRERRKRAAERKKAEARQARIHGDVLGLCDGRTTILLTRGHDHLDVTPTPEEPRRDLFEYWPETDAMRGLTTFARAAGWRLQSASPSTHSPQGGGGP